MLDAIIRPHMDPLLNSFGQRLSKTKISANWLTGLGFLFGLVTIGFIAFHHYMWAAFFIILNRICDGLDGAVARVQGLTDLGGFLDITADFIIYAGVIFAFALADHESAIWPAFLIFSYIGPITTFLAFATIAEKRGISTQARGHKSFYYLGGICEGFETAFVMVLLCFKPDWLAEVCLVYGIMCWLTTLGRVMSAWGYSRNHSL